MHCLVKRAGFEGLPREQEKREVPYFLIRTTPSAVCAIASSAKCMQARSVAPLMMGVSKVRKIELKKELRGVCFNIM